MIICFLELMEELSLQNSKELEIDAPEPLCTENDVVTFKLKYLGEYLHMQHICKTCQFKIKFVCLPPNKN